MDRKKCSFCKRKCHLLMQCRCKMTFCIEHVNSEEHECTFDYKEYGKSIIEQQNPKLKTQKIESI
jgi:hypothetical protein